MRVIMLMAQHDELAEAAHAMGLIVVLQAGETFLDRRILLWLGGLCADLIVAEGMEAYDGQLVCVKGAWDDWSVGVLVVRVVGFPCEGGLILGSKAYGFALVRRCAGMVDIAKRVHEAIEAGTR
jgi:hypothetical protein